MRNSIRGVLPAVVTPLDDQEQVAVRPAEQLFERMYAAGSDGVYVCGQTGEGLLLESGQRKRMTEIAVRNSPAGKQVIIHVGALRTSEAVDLAKHAARTGAHAIGSLPPITASSFAEVRRYYEAIAAATDLPVLVYFFPDFSGSISTLEQIFDLCTIPNVVGLKFTDFDFYKLSLIARAGRVIFNGRDEAFASGALMGASGGIGSFYNLTPELFVSLWAAAEKGDFAEARALQDRINDLIRVVLQVPMLPAIKQLLTWSGIDCGPCLEPRRPLAQSEVEWLKTSLPQIGFDPGGFLRTPTTASA